MRVRLFIDLGIPAFITYAVVDVSALGKTARVSSELAPCFLCNASRMMSARAANVIDNVYFFVYGNVKSSVVLTRRGDLKMANPQAQFPRVVRAAPEPLGWYVRPSYVDHRAIADAVGGGSIGLHGVVFDPLYDERHSELRHLIVERNRDAILDPRTQELGSIGGFNKRLSALPWALDRPHGPDDFADANARRMADSMAQFVVEKRYTAVLAPTHYIESANSPWLEIDAQSTAHLRRYLDRAGARSVPIFYSLAVSYEAFRNAEERQTILEKLIGLPIDSLWLKVSQSGTLTHASVRNLVTGAAEFHALGGAARWRHDGRSTWPQRLGVRCGWRNLPRRHPEGAF